MKKILLSVSLLSLLLIVKSESAKAQADSVQTSNINVTIATVTELSADNGSLATFAFTNGADLEAGITQTNAVTLSYKSNKATKIQIKALGTGNFTGGSGDMPVGVIKYKKNGASGEPIALSTTAADLTATQSKGSGSFGIDYKITPGLTYDPATDYAVTIEYTLTPQ